MRDWSDPFGAAERDREITARTVLMSTSPRARTSLGAHGSATRRRLFAASEPVQLQLG